MAIRLCLPEDMEEIARVINEAAQAYRGVVPQRFLGDPYMSRDELAGEMSTVTFFGYEEQGQLIGVMAIEPVGDVTLLRHAYVRGSRQRRGIGTSLLQHMESLTLTPWLLLGTWRDSWAVNFYRKHGFEFMPAKDDLLTRYWHRVGADQAAESIVLGKILRGV